MKMMLGNYKQMQSTIGKQIINAMVAEALSKLSNY